MIQDLSELYPSYTPSDSRRMPSIEAVIDFWVEQDVEWLHGYYLSLIHI